MESSAHTANRRTCISSAPYKAPYHIAYINMEAVIQQAVIEQAVVNVARQLEDQIDTQLHKLDNLQDEDLEKLRQRRIDELRRHEAKCKEWIGRGHGEYRELLSEKDFFAEIKGEERAVCHFYRENWPCKVMDKHIALLTKRHIETKFMKINAEKSPFLTERLKIWMLPTLALIKHEKTVDYVVGFDDLGGKDDFTTEQLEDRLAAVDMCKPGEHVRAAASEPSQKRSVRSGSQHRTQSDEDSDFED